MSDEYIARQVAHIRRWAPALAWREEKLAKLKESWDELMSLSKEERQERDPGGQWRGQVAQEIKRLTKERDEIQKKLGRAKSSIGWLGRKRKRA